MMENDLSVEAINVANKGEKTYCKFLTSNDTGKTKAHQSGVLISLSAKYMIFTDGEMKENHILKKSIKVNWQNNKITDSTFTWYESKGELRLTKFGKGFDMLRPEYTGALFVLIKMSDVDYSAYILNTDNEIQAFLDAFGLTPAETNRLINADSVAPEVKEKSEIDRFIGTLETDFPSSEEMSREARMLVYAINVNSKLDIVRNPDKLLLEWTDEEYRLFRAIEHERYGKKVSQGFSSVDEFIMLANKVLNRRKSRAGKSLEHHLAAIFDGNKILYTPQAVTEGNKKPDFIFPSEEAYHDVNFRVEDLCTLAAKTTCKDRWRQVLNEADRLRDRNKYLCTMQQGISAAQMDEMAAEKVILVVPKPYISAYPKEKRDRIWTIEKFVRYIKDMEKIND